MYRDGVVNERQVGGGFADVWSLLVGRKWLILVGLSFGLMAGIAFVMLKAPAYESALKVRLGQVDGEGPIEGPGPLSARLMASYGEFVADGVKRSPAFLRRVSSVQGTADVMEIVTRGTTPAEAVSLLHEVLAEMRRSQDEIYGRNVQYLSDRLKKIELYHHAMEQEAARMTALVDRLGAENSVQASLTAIERARLVDLVRELDVEALKLTKALTPPQSRPFEVLGDIVAPTKPASPPPALIVLLAMATGLLGGVVMAASSVVLVSRGSAVSNT